MSSRTGGLHLGRHRPPVDRVGLYLAMNGRLLLRIFSLGLAAGVILAALAIGLR